MTGLLLGAAALLVVAGTAKMARPADTARALHVHPLIVRVGAALEVAIGCAAFVAPWAGIAVAASYGAFAVFVAVALWRGWPLSSCGCFGEPDSLPSPMHVIVDLVLGASALAATLSDGRAPAVLIGAHPGWGATTVVSATVIGGLAYLSLTRLPRLRGSM
ncbi:MAG: MauE/DoxX family redox-associated membrane protein [Acidimicrobiales bacterium]